MKSHARSIRGRFALALSLGLMCLAVFAQSLEVIELKNRTAEEVIPVLRPLLPPGAALSGQNYQLFVRTTSANLAEIRRALEHIDRAPRQLLVSVRTATRQQIENERITASGVLSNRGATATIGGANTTGQRSAEGISSVAVLEGNAASIHQGADVPVVTIVGGSIGRRRWVGAQTEYRDVSSGFIVTPRLNGELVTLEIAQQAQSARGATIDTQRVTTQVSGRLGEWLPLGQVTQSAQNSEQGIGTHRYSTHSDERAIWVKVEAQ